jgi:hypothetical protein
MVEVAGSYLAKLIIWRASNHVSFFLTSTIDLAPIAGVRFKLQYASPRCL